MAKKLLQTPDSINVLTVNGGGGQSQPYTGYSPINVQDYIIRLEETAMNALTAVPSKLDLTAFSEVSGNFASASQINELSASTATIYNTLTGVELNTVSLSSDLDSLSAKYIQTNEELIDLQNDFSDFTNDVNDYFTINNENITEMSGKIENINSFNGVWTDNTLSGDGLNTPLSVIGGGSNLSAGTDLVIDSNNIISINTNGTVGNSADMSFVAGQGTYASGIGAAAFGQSTYSYGNNSFTVGNGSRANDGGIALGLSCTANGAGAVAEGRRSTAASQFSHAEGNTTIASSVGSHAEGNNTSAIKEDSHAEGWHTIASGYHSHAEGESTIAGENNMHTCGQYNYTSSNAAFVIGNGTDDNTRSDAFIVDWNGTASATSFVNSAGEIIALIPTANQPTNATACSIYYGTDGKYYILH